jgi:hypothetical protein
MNKIQALLVLTVIFSAANCLKMHHNLIAGNLILNDVSGKIKNLPIQLHSGGVYYVGCNNRPVYIGATRVAESWTYLGGGRPTE